MACWGKTHVLIPQHANTPIPREGALENRTDAEVFRQTHVEMVRAPALTEARKKPLTYRSVQISDRWVKGPSEAVHLTFYSG